jgi:hypothetical protein
VKVKNLLNTGPLVIQRHLLKFAQQGASQTSEPPLGAGIPSKPRDVEHSTTQRVGPYGLRVQGAFTGKPAEDTTIQKLPTAKPKLSGAARRKRKKSLCRSKWYWELNTTRA